MVDRDPDRVLQYVVGFCLFALTFVTYSVVLHHEFVNYDDLSLIVNNPRLTRPVSFFNLLSHFDATDADNGTWLPLYWISMHLGFALHGPNPASFLLTNVLIHAASAVCLFAALRRLTGALWRSAFVAAVFALHPLHVESVAWVTERKDVLAGLFWMLGLYVYAHYTKAPSSKTRYLGVLLCLTLGLMSKSTLVTFPAVLLLLDIWPLDRLRAAKRRVLLEKIPMFALVAIAGSVTLLSQRAGGYLVLGAKIGFGSRLANAIESYWRYLLDAIWPVKLAALYPHPYLLAPVSGRAAMTAAGLGIGLVALTGVILMVSRRRPYLGVGWLWYLGTLVPMIGLVQFGAQARADRYMYLPLVGLSIMLAWGIGDLVPANRRKLSAALAGAALIALTIVTRVQIGHWENSIALFERAVAVTERNFYAHERLAYELLEAERFEEARGHYLAAIAIAPWYGPFYYSLALTYERAGDDDAAIAAHQKALRVKPNMVPSHGSLGLLLLRAGQPARARRHLLIATRAMPDSAEYRDALAAVMSELERAKSGDPQI